MNIMTSLEEEDIYVNMFTRRYICFVKDIKSILVLYEHESYKGRFNFNS